MRGPERKGRHRERGTQRAQMGLFKGKIQNQSGPLCVGFAVLPAGMWAAAVASRCRHGLATLCRPASRRKPPTQQKKAGSHVGHAHFKTLEMKLGQNTNKISPLLLGFVVFWPDVLAKSVSSSTSVSTGIDLLSLSNCCHIGAACAISPELMRADLFPF